MIEIINTRGEIMELSSDISIPIERNNPLFNDADKFFQDITYPGKALISPANMAFFENGQRVDALNSVYEFPVRVIVAGFHFFSGNLKYKIVKGNFEFQLKVNYGAIAEKVSKTRLTELRTLDNNNTVGATEESLAAHMLDTCVNPQNHNYIFVPVHNPHAETFDDFTGMDAVINHFDFSAQEFKIYNFTYNTGNFKINESPFFKLKYILKKVFEYLGFNAQGSFFEDLETENLLIYTRKALNRGITPKHIVESMRYMPNMTIADFLKFIRLRLHLGIDFDLKNNLVQLNSFDSVSKQTDSIDIIDYVEEVQEIEINPVKGYTISLIPDENDEAYAVYNGDNKEHRPTQQLIIGDGKEKVEINCSTLKTETLSGRKQLFCKQGVLTGAFTTPPDLIIPTEATDISTLNNWPLKLIKYNGIKQIGSGIWPEGDSFELNDKDGNWFQFLNDSKAFKIFGNFPVDVLNRIGSCNKITFRSKEGATVVAIPKKIRFDLAKSTELIAATIDALSLRFEAETPIKYDIFDKVIDEVGEYIVFLAIKAYYTPEMGFKKIKMEAFGDTYQFTVNDIVEPTDYMGAGGNYAYVKYYAHSTSDIELRVYTGQPKHIHYYGNILPFTLENDYYKVLLPFLGVISDYDSAWIVY